MSSRRGGGARAETAQATRDALLDAARAAFAEQGFDAPSLDAICARAGLTRGAFYVHFSDREALVVAVVSQVVERFLDAILAGGDTADLAGAVRRFADAVVVATASRGRHEPLVATGLLPLHRMLEAAHRSPAIRARLVEIAAEARDRVAVAARRARAAGALRDDVEPAHLAALLVALALGVLGGAEVGVPLEVDALRDTLGALVAAPGGAAPPTGRRRR